MTLRGPYEPRRPRAHSWRRFALPVLLLALSLNCDDNQVQVPVDPHRVVWTRLTNPADVKNPTYSDWRGDSIIFHYVNASNITRLAMINADGTGLRILAQAGSSNEAYPRWLTDDVVIYCTDDPGGLFGFDLHYRILSTDEEWPLTTFILNEFAPAPRPGRPQVAYVEGSNIFRGQIVLIPDTTAATPDRIEVTPDSLTVGEPDWSPDGTRLCFTAEKDGTRSIWVAEMGDTSATSMKRITTGPFFDFFPRFSPDGTKILFTSNRTGRPGVWWVSPDGEESGLELISFEDSSDPSSPGEATVLVAPCWSPDGTKIVISTNARGDRALWILSNLPF